MTYTSFHFLVFLAVVVFLYYVVPKRFQWAVLLAASYGFYLSGGTKHVIFIVSTTMITYLSGLWMQKIRDDHKKQTAEAGASLSKEEKRELKKQVGIKIHRVQTISVLADLAILVMVKYTNFAIKNLNAVFGMFAYDINIPFINILVPLGISFYTFQSMGYLIDIGRGKYQAERHLGRLALFVSFFPSIVQGPINRYGDLGEQFKIPHKFDYTTVKFGIQLMLWGFFKKLVIADRIAIPVNQVFNNFTEYTGDAFIFAALAYAVQIYCDFSGGIDIARGAAQMLDIHLPINFERPYFSKSVAEYWRRWHASLGAWMREYVFYPIMLSEPVTKISKFFRKRGMAYVAKMVPSVITPFVVFMLIGIWHGASWKYVAFGLYNAVIVAGGVALTPVFKKGIQIFHINQESAGWKFFCMLRTFFICCIGKVIAHALSLKAGLYMLKEMFLNPKPDFLFGADKGIFLLGLESRTMFILCLAILVLLTVSILQERGMKMRETIAKQNLLFRWALYAGIIMVILVFGVYGPGYSATEFIYQAY